MRVQLIVPIAALPLSNGAAEPASDVVAYHCVTASTREVQDIKVRIELTVPADATAGTQTSIGWHGAYAEGTELRAPATGTATGLKLYAYAGISDFPGLTSATGVGRLGILTPGAAIPLPDAVVPLKTTARNAGTGNVHAAAINFGPRPSERVIECEVQNRGTLTEHPLTVKPATGPGATDTTDSPDTGNPSDTGGSAAETPVRPGETHATPARSRPGSRPGR